MTRYAPDKHHRRSIRLRGFDYARPGAYFVTICTYNRECVLGQIEDGKMILSEWGGIVNECWRVMPSHFPDVPLDAFVVMPNHVHGIVVIMDDRRGTACRAPTTERFGQPVAGSVPTIIRSFKSATTRQINDRRATPGMPLWQRNYYEHVIRTEVEWNEIRTYIAENPLRWELDENHPSRLRAPDQDQMLKYEH